VSEVWAIQHIHCETLGTIADALKTEGIAVRHIRTFEGQAILKEMGGAAGLVSLDRTSGVSLWP
jgi:hypothetical protein